MPVPSALPEAGLFDKFPVAELYRGASTMPDFEERDRKFKDFRTRIRNGIKEGPNFAGRYKVIQFGCGTGCNFVLVADVSTGRVHNFPHGGEYDQELQLEYRLSSSLIRARWVPNMEKMDSCLLEDFLLKDGDFLSLGRSGPAACYAGYCENGVCKSPTQPPAAPTAPVPPPTLAPPPRAATPQEAERQFRQTTAGARCEAVRKGSETSEYWKFRCAHLHCHMRRWMLYASRAGD